MEVTPADYLDAALRRMFASLRTGNSSPCESIVFPSGVTGKVMILTTTSTRAVVCVTPDYEPAVKDTHPSEMERIIADVDRINAAMPSRFGRPLGKVSIAFQSGQQYTITKDDADWIHAAIGAVCPVARRWIGHGGEWCISHEVNPSEIVVTE